MTARMLAMRSRLREADYNLAALLDGLYACRPCFICGQSGWCGHREPVADLAELDAES
jgi:hypothetical protein